MTEKKTEARLESPTVLVVGATESSYVQRLVDEPYRLVAATTASEAAEKMPALMPQVVILSPRVPMPEHRIIHETALAVGAIVLLIPDDAHHAVVMAEIEDAMSRASRKRDKRV
jgi:hypothetical protein